MGPQKVPVVDGTYDFSAIHPVMLNALVKSFKRQGVKVMLLIN